MYWPYLAVLVLLAGFMAMSVRNRRRQVTAEVERANAIAVGTEVMTTSGLYATVVARNDDGTAVLSIAPGVEVRWAVAALRDAESLAPDYRRGLESGGEAGGGDAGTPGADLRKPGSGPAET